ncbi:MAG TPA: T9SS type A sorting domain-containing protein [Niastella sp.]|nr:T9SS type A sorting domain-containing protein [Niastella sp.]
MATNFTGTPYATVPSGSKTADINFLYQNAPVSLSPYAITKIFVTTNGVTTEFANTAGPAGAPVASGQDVLVKYCIYGAANLPTSGVISFQFSNVQTGQVVTTCSYDAGCTSNCALVANPVLLPITFKAFEIKELTNSAYLNWNTDYDADAKGFEIERSKDGINYITVGYVNYQASPGMTTSFSFNDLNKGEGPLSYYRIRVVNRDGGYYFSATKVLKKLLNASNVKISLVGKIPVVTQAGNPVKLFVRILDTQGKLIEQGESNAAKFTLSRLKTGVYHLQVITGKQLLESKTLNVLE